MSDKTVIGISYNNWNKVDSIPDMSYETKSNNEELNNLIKQFMESDSVIICKECKTANESRLLAVKLRSYMNSNAFKNSQYGGRIKIVKRRLNVYLKKVD